MSRNLLTAGLGLLVLVSVVCRSGAAVSATPMNGTRALAGTVPSVVAGLVSNGRFAATNQINLAIGLPLRNTNELEVLLKQVYDPASTNFHRYLTPEQFTAQFGPTEQDYQSVVDFATANGLTVVTTHPNRVMLDVAGKASDVEKAFNVNFKTYHLAAENRDFFSTDVEPSVPAMLPIQDISGFENYRRPYPKYRRKPAGLLSAQTNAASSKDVQPKATTGSGPGGNYIGDDFRKAYVPGTTLNGSGQTVALFQADGYLASDIAAYEALAGRTNVPLQNILIDGFNGQPTGNGGEGEVSLDIEMVVSMAPALSQIILYEGNPNNYHPNNILNRIATDNLARQVSSSWGWSGGPSVTTDQIFKQMALQGQTFFNASGDSDAFTTGINSVNSVDSPFIPNAPSDSPYITQVGGTTLTMNGAGSSYSSETVWNWGVRYPAFYDGAGSSGGISSFYSIPAWQTNINFAASLGSTNFRNTPDVAMTADDVLVISDGGQVSLGTGGTSCAAPLWAGFIALVNQQATNVGHGAVGFINPALYTIASGTNYANCFHDVTTGNNKWSASPSQFSAVTGYDLCTGLGTPKGTNLINALVSPGLTNTVISPTPPPPPYGTTLSSLIGSNPNGSWTLYIQDDTAPEGGVISNGWSLNLTSANPVGFAADLAVTKTASASTVVAGSNLVYFITVTNYGPSTSSNVLVSDDLPAGLSLVSTNTTVGSVLRSGSTVIWNAGTLATNAGGQLTLVVKTSIAGTVVNSAISSSDTPDPNPDDNVASATVNVVASSPPQLSGSYVGGNHQFQFLITDPSLQAYVVQASTNLVNWVPIYTNPAPSLTTTTNIDTSSTNFPYRFYRVLLQ